VQALFARDADLKSEAFVLIEFRNVLATYLRADSLTRNQAHALLVEAEKRLTGLISLPHARALRVAEQFGVSAYDARFLGAAQSFKARLVTEDAPAQSCTCLDNFAFRRPRGVIGSGVVSEARASV
jgi:predicted nucleic acid-binding protein